MRARRHVTRREQPFRFCHWLIALLVLCSPLLRLRLAGEGLVHAERVGQWLRARAARHAIQEAHATARIWARRVDRRLLGRQAPLVPREAPLLWVRRSSRSRSRRRCRRPGQARLSRKAAHERSSVELLGCRRHCWKKRPRCTSCRRKSMLATSSASRSPARRGRVCAMARDGAVGASSMRTAVRSHSIRVGSEHHVPVSHRVGQVGSPVEIFAVALRRGLRHDPAAAWRALRTSVVAGGRESSIPRKITGGSKDFHRTGARCGCRRL